MKYFNDDNMTNVSYAIKMNDETKLFEVVKCDVVLEDIYNNKAVSFISKDNRLCLTVVHDNDVFDNYSDAEFMCSELNKA